MDNGWISLQRKFLENYLWTENRVFNKAEAWIDLLFMANFKDAKVIFNGKFVEVKRGSFITSEVKLKDKWRWSKTKVRAFLKLLEDDGMIIKESDNKKTTLTIVKYNEYQNLELQKDSKRTSKELQKDFKKTQYNKDNKENKENKEINISFDEFWNLYDKKIGKEKSEKKWNKLKDQERQKIIDTLPNWKKQFTDKQYQPYPTTYLNDKRWNDEIEKPKQPQVGFNDSRINSLW